MVEATSVKPRRILLDPKQGLERLRKNDEQRAKGREGCPSAAKAAMILLNLTYGLKPVPFEP
jgi:hypothetical protein